MAITYIKRIDGSTNNLVYLETSDTTATATASGYITAQTPTIDSLNEGGWTWETNDCIMLSASDGISWCSIDSSFTTLTAFSGAGAGDVTYTAPSVANALAIFTNTAGHIGDNIAGVNAVSTSSATPGTIRSLTGKITETATTMTSGTLTGVRGEADLVSASGGFVYGVQGKVIPTGTLSGSIWAPAVFGQYDLSAATLNAGQIAAVWGDMGASGGTFTDVTGARMFAGTNTIASLTLNSMIYLYGKATNLFELSGSSSTYIAAAGGTTPSGTNKTIALTIDGVTYYLLASTVWS